jgi:hypothetical protein
MSDNVQTLSAQHGHARHADAVSLEGLDDLFRWASEMVADPSDNRVKRSRDQRLRRQVMDAVSELKEAKQAAKSAHEIAYVQRRLIAVLQQLSEYMAENTSLKQMVVAQYYSLQQIPALELELAKLRTLDLHNQQHQANEQKLMTAIAKLKKDRDFLEELVLACEHENDRLAKLLYLSRQETATLRAKRWWHIFWQPKK